MFLQIMFLICSVFNTYGVASSASLLCRTDQYRAGQFCCLACPGGYRVHQDCTATTITLCSKCPEGTFKEGFSGQKQCSACTKCGTGLGLKVKMWCTPTSDALCEPLDGFFCSDSADKDTFSDATSSCQPHTICDSGVQIKPGTGSTDSTCITYVAIAFIIIGCILFIISIIVALVYRRHLEKKKLDRELDELANLIREAETLEQAMECDASIDRLLAKKKTTEQERKLKDLRALLQEKKEKLELDREITELANLIHEKETLEQAMECDGLIYRLQMKKKTTEQERKLNDLRALLQVKKEKLELDRELTELANLIREAETLDQCKKCHGLIDRLLKKKKTLEQERKFDDLRALLQEKWKPLKYMFESIYGRLKKKKTQEPNRELNGGADGEETSGLPSTPHPSLEPPAGLETSSPPAPSSETQPDEELAKLSLERETPKRWWESAASFGRLLPKKKTQEPNMELNGGADGEETSGLPSTPHPSLEPSAGLETSSPPAPSSETQPDEETTPLMSSDSPAPTGDQQEHTSRTTIPDVTTDDHDGQLDIEMGPVQTLPKDGNRIL